MQDEDHFTQDHNDDDDENNEDLFSGMEFINHDMGDDENEDDSEHTHLIHSSFDKDLFSESHTFSGQRSGNIDTDDRQIDGQQERGQEQVTTDSLGDGIVDAGISDLFGDSPKASFDGAHNSDQPQEQNTSAFAMSKTLSNESSSSNLTSKQTTVPLESQTPSATAAVPSKSPNPPNSAIFSTPANESITSSAPLQASYQSGSTANPNEQRRSSSPVADTKGKGRATPEADETKPILSSTTSPKQSDNLQQSQPFSFNASSQTPSTSPFTQSPFDPTPSSSSLQNRPPSPAKRFSPTRNLALAQIPEEEHEENEGYGEKVTEEGKSQEKEVRSSEYLKDATTAPAMSRSNTQGSNSRQEKLDRPSTQNNHEDGPSPLPAEAIAATSAQQTNTSEALPSSTELSTAAADEQVGTAPSAAGSQPERNGIDASMAPQQHQQQEIKKQIYILCVPILLMINAELIKGCMSILEVFSQKFPGQEYKMEDRYRELVGRLSSNLGHLAALAGSTSNNSNPPLPVLDAPSTANDTLRMLYNQLKAYFMMGQTKTASLPNAGQVNPIASSNGVTQTSVPAPSLPISGAPQQTLQSSTQAQQPGSAAISIGKRDRTAGPAASVSADAGSDGHPEQRQPKRERLDQTLPDPKSPSKEPEARFSAALPIQEKDFTQQMQQQATAPTSSSIKAQTPKSASGQHPGSAIPASTGLSAPNDVGGAPTQQNFASSSANSFAINTANQQDASQSFPSNIPPHMQQQMHQKQNSPTAPQSPANVQQSQPFMQPQPPINTPQRAPSSASVFPSLQGQPQQVQNTHLRQSSLPPSTPQQAGGFQQQQSQQQMPLQAALASQLQQAATPNDQLQGGFRQAPIPLERLGQDMLRMQTMVQQARSIRDSEAIFNKLPNEAKTSLITRIKDQEAQLDAMRQMYEHYWNRANGQLPGLPPQILQQQLQAALAQQIAQQQSTNPTGAGMVPPAANAQTSMSIQQQGGQQMQPGQPMGMPSNRQTSITQLQQQQPGFAGSPAASHASPAASIHQSPQSAHMSRPPTRQASVSVQGGPPQTPLAQNPQSMNPNTPEYQQQMQLMEHQNRQRMMMNRQQGMQGQIMSSPGPYQQGSGGPQQQPFMGPPGQMSRPGQPGPFPQYPPGHQGPVPRPPSVLRQSHQPIQSASNASTPQSQGNPAQQQLVGQQQQQGQQNMRSGSTNPFSGGPHAPQNNNITSSPAASVVSLTGNGGMNQNSSNAPSPAHSATFGSPATTHMQPPGSAGGLRQSGPQVQGQGNFNMMQQRARMQGPAAPGTPVQGQSQQRPATPNTGDINNLNNNVSMPPPPVPSQFNAQAQAQAQQMAAYHAAQRQQQQQGNNAGTPNNGMQMRGQAPPGFNPQNFMQQQGLPPNFQLSGDPAQQQQQMMHYQQFLQAQRMMQQQQQQKMQNQRAGSPGGVNMNVGDQSNSGGMNFMGMGMNGGVANNPADQQMRLMMLQQQQNQARLLQQQQQQGGAGQQGQPDAQQIQQMQQMMARQQAQMKMQGGPGGPGGPGLQQQPGMRGQAGSPAPQPQSFQGMPGGFNPQQLQAMQAQAAAQARMFPYGQMGPASGQGQVQGQPMPFQQQQGGNEQQQQQQQQQQPGSAALPNSATGGLDFDSYINV